MRRAFLWLAVCGLTLGSASLAAADDTEAKVVKDGSNVGIDYTLKLGDGRVADTSAGAEPLVYKQGGGEVLPVLEKSLAGLRVGDAKQITVPPEDGYGVIDEALYQEVPAEQIPAESRKVGAALLAQDPAGNKRPVRVREVRDDVIVLDLNHPLAGQTLLFDVKIVSID